jgi:hypothetical protein
MKIMSKDKDYFIKPRVFISGKKTVDELLREQKKIKNNETLYNLKIFLICGAAISSIIFLIIFVL